MVAIHPCQHLLLVLEILATWLVCKAVVVVLVYIFWMISGEYYFVHLLVIYMSFVKCQFRSLSQSSLCLPFSRSYFLFLFSFHFSLLICWVLCRSMLHMGPFPITCVLNILLEIRCGLLLNVAVVSWWTEFLISLNSNVAIFSYIGFFFFSRLFLGLV